MRVVVPVYEAKPAEFIILNVNTAVLRVDLGVVSELKENEMGVFAATELANPSWTLKKSGEVNVQEIVVRLELLWHVEAVS